MHAGPAAIAMRYSTGYFADMAVDTFTGINSNKPVHFLSFYRTESLSLFGAMQKMGWFARRAD